MNPNLRVCYATVSIFAALVCLAWPKPRSPQQQYIDLCKANYDSCVKGLCDNKPNYDVCVGKCRADELTCFNNSVNAIARGQTAPPNATLPPGATIPPGATVPPIAVPVH